MDTFLSVDTLKGSFTLIGDVSVSQVFGSTEERVAAFQREFARRPLGFRMRAIMEHYLIPAAAAESSELINLPELRDIRLVSMQRDFITPQPAPAAAAVAK